MVKTQAHVFIEGRVQGVSFRYYTQQKAVILGLSGWVRNLWDGRVEAVFAGDAVAVSQMLAWCNIGAPHARVDSVTVDYQSPAEFHGFNIRY